MNVGTAAPFTGTGTTYSSSSAASSKTATDSAITAISANGWIITAQSAATPVPQVKVQASLVLSMINHSLSVILMSVKQELLR